MTKRIIFHLEDDLDWIRQVRNLLGQDYDVRPARDIEQAMDVFRQMRDQYKSFDLAIIDISLILGDADDKQGFDFIDSLELSEVLPGHRIIVLSGYPEVDNNIRTAFRDYEVAEVFDKGNFLDEKTEFKRKVAQIIEDLRSKEPDWMNKDKHT